MRGLLKQTLSGRRSRPEDGQEISPPICRAMAFPGQDWARARPEDLGLDSRKLDRAMAYLAGKCGRQGTTEAVVIRSGYLVWEGALSRDRHDVWSCTKSFTSTVLGILIDQGACALDTPAAEVLPELKAGYPEVKLVDFATMTSGYDGGGHQSSAPFDPSPALFTPGTRFCYWDSAMNQFAHVLTRIAGRSLKDFFREHVAEPIGLAPQEWGWGDFGAIRGMLVNGGAGNKGRGITISARGLARLGHLFLNRGLWNGQRVISSDWVDGATRVQVPASVLSFKRKVEGPGIYGFNWWVNGLRPGGRRLWCDAPPCTFAAKGFNNNICLVVPEWQMIVVRLGQDGNISNRSCNRFLAKLGDALIRQEQPPAD